MERVTRGGEYGALRGLSPSHRKVGQCPDVDDEPRHEQVELRDVTDHPSGPAGSRDIPDVAIDDKVKLQRNIGFLDGVMMVVGTIIGSGIFISPTGVAIGSGSVGLSLVSWSICGVIAVMGGLCFAELGTVVPESGAEYAYIKAAFGRPMAFMYSWVAITLLKPSSLTIISMTCAKYIISNFFHDGCGSPPPVIVKLLAASIIVVLCVLNSYSVALSSRIATVFTFAKMAALLIIIIGGLVRLGQGYTAHLASGFTNSETNAGAIAIGLYNGLWAYDGWNQLAYMTEELKNPSKNLPRCLILGVVIVTALYIMTNISYFTVMSTQELIQSPAVAVTWAEQVIPIASWLIPVTVAVSTFGAANLTMLSTSRVNFVAARDGLVMNTMSMVHVKHFTPVPALLTLSSMAMLWTLPGDVSQLIDYFSFAVWTTYGLSMVALIVLRTTRKHAHRPFKVPIVIPAVMVLVSAFLVIAPIIQSPRMEQLYAALVILAGLVFYIPFIHYQYRLPGMDYMTTRLQLILQIAPTPAFTIDE